MNQLQVFENELFKVSAKIINGEPSFDVEQVARSLGFTTVARSGNETIRWSRVNSYLPDNLPEVAKGDFIPEPLVYKLAFKAKNEIAEKFQDWLAIEVIPSIRNHGGYLTPEKIEETLLNPDTIIKLATNLKDEQERRQKAELEKLHAERTIQLQKPKVVFAESCLASQDSVLVKDVAKLACNQGISIGQNRLYRKLREWGFIQKGNTQPTQRAIDSGYFEILQRNIQTPDGSKLTRTTKVTTKGQLRIINRLTSEKEREAI
ncbi:phage antirepressor KilAC domain-containing protein [Oceanobacillus neutriphilus]|uniref:Bro-N domain-containing protein n=1 Tax=Oceanobacillus neutriphilus TaxID=531815 RepID=A0ABQ2P3M3_9BACI|nr:phage antirepressor KilAC domain-containing protein [Oceanobacillus neutriphilus]GGP17190.1 hypothetical protein GCM10011346_52130 [Oceanobacillus neutriphilus]